MRKANDIAGPRPRIVVYGNIVGIFSYTDRGDVAMTLPNENDRTLKVEQEGARQVDFDLLALPFSTIARIIRKGGLGFSALQLVGTVMRFGPLQPGDIARRSDMSIFAVSEMLPKLQHILTELPKGRDRREKLFGLTLATVQQIAIEVLASEQGHHSKLELLRKPTPTTA